MSDDSWPADDPVDDEDDEWGSRRRDDRPGRSDNRRADEQTAGHHEDRGDGWGDDRVQARERSQRDRRRDDRRSRRGTVESLLAGSSTYVNALLGGVAGIVLSFVPLSPVLGGAVAGYLEAGPEGGGGSRGAGLTVGGIAGVIMFLPFVLFAIVGFSLVAASGSSTFGGLLLVVFLLVAFYTIGAGMLGGVVGVIVREQVDDRPAPRRNW